MLEFEILARGLYHPNQLKISYNPALTLPTTGPPPNSTLTNPAIHITPDPAQTTPTTGTTHVGAQFTAPSHPQTTNIENANMTFDEITGTSVNVEDAKMPFDKKTGTSVGADLSCPSPIYRPTGESPLPPQQFDDIHHSAPTIQQWIDTLWQQKLTLAQQKNIPLYDTPLYRLIHAEVRHGAKPDHPISSPRSPSLLDSRGDIKLVGAGEGSCGEGTLGSPRGGDAPQLHLTLGNTTYKEYVTTRDPSFAQDRPREELSNPLAVCSVIET